MRCVNCGIGPADGSMTLWRVRGEPGGPETRLASFSRAVLMRQFRRVPDLHARIEPIEVPALTLGTLLDRYRVTAVDLLQIDAEGFDFEVLEMLLATDHRPPVIGFEHLNLSPADKLDCARVLRDHGYRYSSFGRDTVAYRPPARGGHE